LQKAKETQPRELFELKQSYQKKAVRRKSISKVKIKFQFSLFFDTFFII